MINFINYNKGNSITNINEIKAGTYVTPKLGFVYKACSDDIKLVKSAACILDDCNSVGFLIEEGSITECDDFSIGETYNKGDVVFLGLDDIKYIHA